MPRCPNRHEVPDTQAYCGVCGTEVLLTCPNGHQVGASNDFCVECGAALQRQRATSEPSVLGATAAPDDAKDSGRRLWWLVAAGVLVLVLIVGAAVALTRDGGDDEASPTSTVDSGTSTTATSTTTSTTSPPLSQPTPPDTEAAKALFIELAQQACDLSITPDPTTATVTTMDGADGEHLVTDSEGTQLIINIDARLVYPVGGPNEIVPIAYQNCDAAIFLGSADA